MIMSKIKQFVLCYGCWFKDDPKDKEPCIRCKLNARNR